MKIDFESELLGNPRLIGELLTVDERKKVDAKYRIPVYKPSLSGNETRYTNDCLETGWISSKGQYIARFENAFAHYLGNVHCSSVANGTVALHLALLALDIKPGDEVIVPTLTYVATVNAIAYVGAKPVFVDSERGNWNIDCAQIRTKITERTKAILAVHLYGSVCEMEALRAICDEHRLYLIEDVAEALGSTYRNKKVGTFGDVATFSFFGNKTITTGEGGMVVSGSKRTIDRIHYLKSQAVSRTREYWHDEIGYNYRMTNICAAIGLAQLERIDAILSRKLSIARQYNRLLSASNIIFQQEIERSLHSQWMFSIILADSDQRNAVRKSLERIGVETRPLFHPVHKMTVFNSEEKFPVAEDLSSRGMNLPSWPDLPDEAVQEICTTINQTIHGGINT